MTFWSRHGERIRDQRRALTVRVAPAAMRNLLAEQLRSGGCLVITRGAEGLQAQAPSSVSDKHDHRFLLTQLAAWSMAHPDVKVQVLGNTRTFDQEPTQP